MTDAGGVDRSKKQDRQQEKQDVVGGKDIEPSKKPVATSKVIKKPWWKDSRWIAVLFGTVILLVALVVLVRLALSTDNGSPTASPSTSASSDAKKDYNKTIKDVQAKLSKTPNDAGLRKQLGELFQLVDNPKGAVKEYKQAIKAGDKTSLIQERLASALADSGDFDGALDAYQKAISLDPNSFLSYVRTAQIQADKKKDFAGAVDTLNKALELLPDEPTLLLTRARYEEAMGNKAAALTTVNKVLEISPNFPEAEVLKEKLGK